MVLVVAASSGAELSKIVNELDSRNPFDHLEAYLVLAAKGAVGKRVTELPGYSATRFPIGAEAGRSAVIARGYHAGTTVAALVASAQATAPPITSARLATSMAVPLLKDGWRRTDRSRRARRRRMSATTY